MDPGFSRQTESEKLARLLRQFSAVSLVGPRQIGKTTLALSFPHAQRFDLENPRDAMVLEKAQTTLERINGLVIIDEVQRKPDLFPLLRYLIDEDKERKYLLLGSSSPTLIKNSSESLAGRIALMALAGFSIQEVLSGNETVEKHWLRGGYPLSFMTNSDTDSFTWLEHYIATFLNQDIPLLGIRIPPSSLYRFWSMLSHYHGQILNHSELARAFGVSDFTIRHYLEILEGTFMIRLLKPFASNQGKRLIKAPKLYFRDSGLFHSFLGVHDFHSLERQPKIGASFEGYVIEECIKSLSLGENNFFFYRAHSGAELDLFWESNGYRYGLECKYADVPKLTKGNHSALIDLDIHKLFVVYPGKERRTLSDQVEWIPIHQLSEIKNMLQ
jgi:predicted AAA+ superfamily ATPase